MAPKRVLTEDQWNAGRPTPNTEASPAREVTRRGKGRRFSMGAVVAMMTVAVVGSTALGAFAASVVQQQSVGQHADQYGVSTSSVANWPNAPTASVGAVAAGVSTCTASGFAFSASGAIWASAVVGLNGTSPVCKANDYVEDLSFSGASTLTTETDTFTVYAVWVNTGGTALSAAVPFNVDVSGGSNGSGVGIGLELDFGATPPLQISSLSVVVT